MSLDEERYDLVVADEAWDVDYFLHENPRGQAGAPRVDDRLRRLAAHARRRCRRGGATADYNAEMIEQRARFRGCATGRSSSATPRTSSTTSFGPGLPLIRDWTSENFDFAGYVTGFEPTPLGVAVLLRAELGYRPDERVCVVTVGGSGVGGALLRRVLDAVPLVRAAADDLRFVVVTGPRIDPESLPSVPGVEVRGLLPDLVDHLAVCDVAVVQGGLSTTMELTANRRPFVYVPLRRHFEQNLHVRHRLEGYGAGHLSRVRRGQRPGRSCGCDPHRAGPRRRYKPVETDGAAKAAALIAALL